MNDASTSRRFGSFVRHHNTKGRLTISFDWICAWQLRRQNPVAPNDRHRLQRDLARKIETDAGRRTCHIELDERAIDRAAARMSAADLSLNDLAEVVADAIKSSERRVLEHVRRMFKLIDLKFGDQHEKTRISNIHRRLTQAESELRKIMASRN